MNALPLLSLLFLIPAAGIAAIWLWPNPTAARVIALLALLFDLLLAATAILSFDARHAGFQFVERFAWVPSLGVHYAVGVDGLSLPFLPATCLLFCGVVLASWNTVHTLPRLYFSLLLLLAGATLGVFCALDTMLFFLFWELTLVPLFFLVSLWGAGPNRRHAATKYTLVMLAGGVSLLFGFLVVAFAGPPKALVFDLPTLLTMPLPTDVQYLVFLLLLIGFGVKVPLVPLHTWLPLIAVEGPVAVAALLTGLKLGAYGLIRFAVPLAPIAAQDFHWLLAGLGVLSLLFGATTALAQTNLRRMLAYGSLSHVGLVVLGISSFSLQGLQGAVFQLLNFVITSGGLFLLASHMHHRTGSTDIASLGGCARSMPLLASCFLLFGLAVMGLPGTSGFPAEFLLLLSVFNSHAGAGLAALGAVVLGAAYFLDLYRKVFFGPLLRPEVIQASDLVPRELIVVLIFAAFILLFGFWPGPVLELMRPAGEAWVARLG